MTNPLPPANDPAQATPLTDGKVLLWNLNSRELEEAYSKQILGIDGRDINGRLVPAEFARKLERELTALKEIAASDKTYWDKTNQHLIDDLAAARLEVEKATALFASKEKHIQNLAMFVKRLVRLSYKHGTANKLTDDSMNYINDIVADCSPMRKLMDEVMPKKSALTGGKGAGR